MRLSLVQINPVKRRQVHAGRMARYDWIILGLGIAAIVLAAGAIGIMFFAM